MFIKSESYANKKTDVIQSRRTSLGIYCISCEMFTCIEHFKKFDHKIDNNNNASIFYNNIEKYDYYYFMANLRLYVESINNLAKFFNNNMSGKAYNALIKASAYELEKNDKFFSTINLFNDNNSNTETYKNLLNSNNKNDERNPTQINQFIPVVINEITNQFFKNEKMEPKQDK